MKAATFGVLMVGIGALTGILAPGFAAAQDNRAVDLYDDALVVVSEELAYLSMLDRVQPPIPDEVATLPDDIGLDMSLSVEDIQGELDRLDKVDGPAVLRKLRNRGDVLSAPTVKVLSTNVSPAGLVNPDMYLEAYYDLLDTWDQLGGSEFDVDGTSTGIVPEQSAGVEPSGSAGWALMAGALALAVVASLAWWSRSRRSLIGSDGLGESQRESVLEFGRRLLAASTIDELGRVAVDRSLSVTAATGATFAVGDTSWAAGEPLSAPFDLIEQAHRTGRTVRSGSYVVVPVVAAGRVAGHVALNEPTSDPSVIEELAPLIGEGLTNVSRHTETETLAFVDALTGVPNRRRFDHDLTRSSREAAATAVPVAVAMFDVDHFKSYNDANGHQEGDEALRLVAQLISENLRAEDAVYRYGGEEFAALLPGADSAAARAVAERIRAAVEAHQFHGGAGQPGGRVTLSVGVAIAPPADAHSMLAAADAALYRAKERGRNQVVLASADPD